MTKFSKKYGDYMYELESEHDKKTVFMLEKDNLFDGQEIRVLRKLSSKDTIFLDIGANVGVYSVLLSKFSKEVIAFEPHKETGKRFLKNVELNYLGNITFENIALSDKAGKVLFQETEHSTNFQVDNRNYQSGVDTKHEDLNLMIECKTLDEYMKDKKIENEAFLIKLDVEGHEVEVLKGSKKIIVDSKSIFLSEFLSNGFWSNILELNILSRIFYKYNFFLNAQTFKKTESEETALMKLPSLFVLAFGSGTKNYYCIPKNLDIKQLENKGIKIESSFFGSCLKLIKKKYFKNI